MNKQEDILGALSGELHLQVEFEVEPWNEPKPKKTIRPGPPEEFQYNDRDDLKSSQLPKYKLTGRVILFGKEYGTTYIDLTPGRINSAKQDFCERVNWFVRELYESKKLGQGLKETKQLAVQLPK